MSAQHEGRRRFLKAGSLLAGSALYGRTHARETGAGPVSSGSASGSTIGVWRRDEAGLPAFGYTAPPFVPGVPLKGAVVLEDDPYFILGNYRLTAFVHSSGVVRVMTGERAWARLNEGLDGRPDNRATLTLQSSTGTSTIDLVGAQGQARDPQRCTRTFGVGYADFRYASPALAIRRTVSVAPSAAVNTGTPAYLVEVELTLRGGDEQAFVFEESLLAHYVAAADLGTLEQRWPTHYTYAVTDDPDAGRVSCAMSATPADPASVGPDGQPSRNDLSPPGLFMQVVANASQATVCTVPAYTQEGAGKRIGLRFSGKIAAGEQRRFRFVVGLAYADGMPDLRDMLAAATASRRHCSPFINAWNARLPAFASEKDAGLRDEMRWNAYVLEAMATYSAFYDETYVPQGMTYDYVMGITAAPRDHLQHSLPLCYTNPALAKSTIRFVLKKMTYQGEIKYTDLGYGRTSNSAWNTSDQQLYLFLAVAEYLRVTGDAGFLEERTEFLPMEAHYGATTLEKLRRAFAYLRDEVGTGPHGLIRLMNSDWNDMVYADTPVMKSFFNAESHMNSAMALAVLPGLIRQLDQTLPALAPATRERCKTLINGLGQFERANRLAFYADLGDRTFARRLYLTDGVVLGDGDMHIEPQIFLMQDDGFPVARKTALWSAIRDRLLAGETLGPRQREHGVPATKYAPGTCENGGSWNALTGPLIIGVASIDRRAAAALLERMTTRHFISRYPHFWVGHWTAPDTFNSHESGDIAGLPRPGDGGLWFNFAAYCAHAHAWPLYAYLRLTSGGRQA